MKAFPMAVQAHPMECCPDGFQKNKRIFRLNGIVLAFNYLGILWGKAMGSDLHKKKN